MAKTLFAELLSNFPKGWKIQHYIILPTFFYCVGFMIEVALINTPLGDTTLFNEIKEHIVDTKAEERLRQLEAEATRDQERSSS